MTDLPRPVCRDDTVHGADYYTADQMRECAAQCVAAATALVPLTDEQLDSMWRETMSADWEHREFARAIERHYGIGAKP